MRILQHQQRELEGAKNTRIYTLEREREGERKRRDE